LSADRIRKMGEEEWRITVSGAPGLDDILAGKYDAPELVLKKYDLDPGQLLFLVVQHPVTTQPERAGEQMATTLDAIESFDAQTVFIYPNSDAGSDRMTEEIESRSESKDLHTFRSLPRREFLGLMDAADVMIGNSSSGIIEAPSFDLPVIDVGPRQDGRERAENTISVPHETGQIRDAISVCLSDELFRKRVVSSSNPYDYDGASDIICDTLVSIGMSEQLMRKKLDVDI